MKKVLLQCCMAGIRAYQWVSPLMAVWKGPFGACRFTPSCSHYALEQLERHGFLRGVPRIFKRFLSCQPFWDSQREGSS